jgi:hypothetical protein
MRSEAVGQPSVERALQWLFDDVIPGLPDDGRLRNRLRNANMLHFAVDPDCDHYVTRARDATAAVCRRTDTHVSIPFALLRTLVVEFPAHCLLGDTLVYSKMLPQGLGISSPGSILQAAYQRSVKFDNELVPSGVLSLMRDYPIKYVDDCLA